MNSIALKKANWCNSKGFSTVFPGRFLGFEGLRTRSTKIGLHQVSSFFNKSLPDLNGYVVVDKPLNVTSTEVVRFFQSIVKCYYEGLSTSKIPMPLHLNQKEIKHSFVKKQPSNRRVGHGGTLDPMATGLLVIAIGQATKNLSYFLDGAKEYTAVGRLGNATDSMDSVGSIISSTSTEHINRELLEKALPKFTGTYLQTPPIYSAIRVNGTRLYEHARNPKKSKTDIPLEIPQRLVTVDKLELTRFWHEEKLDSFGKLVQFPFFEVKIRCGKGFYVRSLVNDLGLAVKSSAFTAELRRTAQFPFTLEQHKISLEDCYDLDKLRETTYKLNRHLTAKSRI